MLKKLLAFAFVAATCSAATAAPISYNFSYVGALRSYDWPGSELWLSDYQINGSFTGEDKDHNGVLSLTELSSLKIEGTDINASDYVPQGNCDCSLQLFNFKLKEQSLFFAAGYQSGVSSFITSSGVYVSSGHNEHLNYYFEDDTVFTLTAVPEPSTYAMMGAGLLGIAVAQRRRKKSA